MSILDLKNMHAFTESTRGLFIASKLILLAIVSAMMLPPVLNDAQANDQKTSDEPPMELPDDRFVEDVRSRSVFLGKASVIPADKPLIQVANSVLRDRVVTDPYTHAPTAELRAVANFPISDKKSVLAMRYRLGWVEWPHLVSVNAFEDGKSEKFTKALREVSLAPLRIAILDRQEVAAILEGCDNSLIPEVRELRPPFYNRPTNVQWDSSVGAPILQSMAYLDKEKNQCVRADVNLRDGNMLCREVACIAE